MQIFFSWFNSLWWLIKKCLWADIKSETPCYLSINGQGLSITILPNH